jgi:membrane-associated protease RseP (regulator of RpoE activity)
MADDDATKADDAATTDQQPATDAAAAPDANKEPKEPKEPKERKTLAVPAWAAGVLAAILLLGAGFAIGWVSNDGGGGGERHEIMDQRIPRPLPRGPQSRQFPPLDRRNQQNQQNPQGPSQASGAFLGVQVVDASGNQSGASVAAVEPGGPADAAGIKVGDVITAVDGNNVNNAAQLAGRISSHSAGDKITITLTRNGSSQSVDVTLGSRSSSLPGLPNGGSSGGTNNGPSAPGLPGIPNSGNSA